MLSSIRFVCVSRHRFSLLSKSCQEVYLPNVLHKIRQRGLHGVDSLAGSSRPLDWTRHYDRLGFTSAIGSIDVNRIVWAQAPFGHSLSYTGKEGYLNLSYEVSVDHSGRTFVATKGYPGSHVDKSIMCLDESVKRVRTQVPCKSVEYNTFKADEATEKLLGLHLICDGGYHEVSAHGGQFLQAAGRLHTIHHRQLFQRSIGV